MRTIHDALRDSQEYLPDDLRRSLARLFAEDDLLALLSTRLLVLGRQGVPSEPPPPHFASECTPPLAAAFAFFQEAVTAWHNAPDSPQIAILLADALVACGVPNLLVLLGQRRTPASSTDASALPPARSTLLTAALAANGPGDRLTVAARALAKHAPRCPAFWGEVAGSSEDKNKAAQRMLEHLLDHATWWNVFGHFEHECVYEVRVPSGHGARWGHFGAEFIGFVEPFEEGEDPPGRA